MFLHLLDCLRSHVVGRAIPSTGLFPSRRREIDVDRLRPGMGVNEALSIVQKMGGLVLN